MDVAVDNCSRCCCGGKGNKGSLGNVVWSVLVWSGLVSQKIE